jgi:uncharacterized membrane protein YfcA
VRAFWKYASIGISAGIVNGLLGIGGGCILVPGMIYLLEQDEHTAHGTSLAIVLPTAIVSVLVYRRHGALTLPHLFTVLLLAVIGGVIGAWVMNYIPSKWLRRGFAVYMALAGLRMLWR